MREERDIKYPLGPPNTTFPKIVLNPFRGSARTWFLPQVQPGAIEIQSLRDWKYVESQQWVYDSHAEKI